MIKTFADDDTREFFETGESRKVPPDIARRALRKLELVDNATLLTDLRMPPGNRLHPLKGNRAGQYAISINDQWRICFRFTSDGIYDVEICDYH
ncbi:MAG: type II toxin-antitoxin system RelE/ParE family toxin [Adlercreutzia sp.]|uniref:type II toxin-antitoxin system RelE/ParE family toxin n=1 Tax=uncultured Adlercreutzia sp. TaxID=875803 RepID=UPI002170B005|nr:type II toxin-antitoxin system RelE/ParE family toxin [uncultured Adlercreutzia sp.]MCI8425149.1 type II toxin-antitoxin system RelE/ParE family toxin [Adlercreutzia sp.]